MVDKLNAYILPISIYSVTITALIILEGIVQGVGLRYAVRYKARRHNLAGYVKNHDNGTVEISCSGKRTDMDGFIQDIKELAEPIIIDNVNTSYSEIQKHSGTFKIVTGDQVDEMVEGFSTGFMYLEKLNQKQDVMIEKQDVMIEKQDVMIEKQKETVKEIRDLSSNIHDTLDSRFERIESEISEIKTKINI